MPRAVVNPYFACCCCCCFTAIITVAVLVKTVLKPDHEEGYGPFQFLVPSYCEYTPPSNTNYDLALAPGVDVTLISFFTPGEAELIGVETEPIAIAFSGGGWNSLAQHMGAVRALADLSIALPPTLSSNSGGTWFLMMLAYSSKFADAVFAEDYAPGTTPNSIGVEYESFMSTYLGSASMPAQGFHVRVLEAISRASPAIAQVLSVVELYQVLDFYKVSWQEFISAMLDAYEPGISLSPVRMPTTSQLRGSSLAVTSAASASVYLGESSAISNSQKSRAFVLDRHLDPESLVPAPMPVLYEVTGGGEVNIFSPRTSRWTSQVATSKAQILGGASFEDSLPRTPMAVGQLAAASSATGALFGSLTSFAQVVGYTLKDSKSPRTCLDALRAVGTIWPIMGLENMGVCTSEFEGDCKFPHGRWMDGSFSDNTGLAAAIAKLQRSHPSARRLRLFLSLANSCTGDLTMENCNEYDNSLERLFATEPVARSGSRYPSKPGVVYTSTNRGPSPAGSHLFSQQLFAEACPQWQAHGPSVFRTHLIDVTTVDNPAYGVRGGTQVSLFVVYGNVGASCPAQIWPWSSAQKTKVGACTQLANGMHTFLTGMGESNIHISAYTTSAIPSPAP